MSHVWNRQLPRPHLRRHASSAPLARDRDSDAALLLDLSRALHLWPSEIDLGSAAGRARIGATLRRALRVQRRRALAGHWAYDFACHARLLDLHRRVGAGSRRQRPS